jgi:hypothetical protein
VSKVAKRKKPTDVVCVHCLSTDLAVFAAMDFPDQPVTEEVLTKATHAFKDRFGSLYFCNDCGIVRTGPVRRKDAAKLVYN